MTPFQLTIRRWTLLLDVLQILIGCLVGFIPPTEVAWFRGIVMSHLEYIANGMLMILFGFLVSELRLGKTALRTWFVSLLVGTWFNGTAGVVGAFAGGSSHLMPTINEKFPAPHGTSHPGVTGLLMICGISMMIALTLTVVGLVKRPSE